MNKIIKSALVSALLMAILSMASYIVGVGDIFKIDTKILINTGVISLVTGLVSIIKSLGTSKNGTFAGIKIK